MRQRTCYVAGPMRGLPAFNFPAFDKAAALLRAKGWKVISPAEIDREHGDVDGLPPDTKFTAAQNRAFYVRDSNALLSLNPDNGDAIFFLASWDNSTGAIAEFAIGKWLGLRLYEFWEGDIVVDITANVKLLPQRPPYREMVKSPDGTTLE